MRTKFALAAAAAVLMSSTAFAADLPQRSAPIAPIAMAPMFSWTGGYIGLNAGYSWNDTKLDYGNRVGSIYYAGIAGAAGSQNEGSFTGGVQAGYNYQIGSFVLGAEADFNYADLKERVGLAFTNQRYAIAGEADHKVQWFGSLRARLGVTPTERMLVYATGGVAFGSVKSSAAYAETLGGAMIDNGYGAVSNTRWGWALGAGMEYAFTQNITAKVEYLYTDLDSKHYNVNSVFTPASHFVVKDETKFHTVRVGVNYKF